MTKLYFENYVIGYNSESIVSFSKVISQLLNGKVIVERLPLVLRNLSATENQIVETNNNDDKNNDDFFFKDTEKKSE